MRGPKSDSDSGRRHARLLLAAVVGGLATLVGLTAAPQARAADSTTTFAYTGGVQTFTVPAGITSLTITAVGAGGGASSAGASYGAGGDGGAGISVTATYTVSPGDTLHVIVGGGGAPGSIVGGGGGGGGSFVFDGTTLLIAAGGGGGGGSLDGSTGPGLDANSGGGGDHGAGALGGGGAGGSSGTGGSGVAGGGGGGTLGDGSNGSSGTPGLGGGHTTASAGGAGGAGGDDPSGSGGSGGYGGGGGGGGRGVGAPGGGGGGGGYSGGGGGAGLGPSGEAGGGGGGGSSVGAGTSSSTATGAAGGVGTASGGTAGANGSVSIVYTLLAQAITFADPGPQSFGTTPTLTATSDSGLTVGLTSATPTVCTVGSGGALAFLTAGTCTIDADQAGNGSYAPAAQVSRTFTVSAVAPAAPTAVTATAGDRQATVSFTAPPDSGATTSYTATASGGVGPTVSCAGSPCTVGGLTNGRSYTFTLTATNSLGSATSAASNSVTPKAAQTIGFANPGTQEYASSPTLSATSDSGLAVGFSSATASVCTVGAGGVLSFHANGSCTIDADQPGNSAFLAAATVAQTFTVEGAPAAAPAPTAPTSTATSSASSTPAADPVPTQVALLDTESPTAPSLHARLARGQLVLTWSAATDDVGVDHYRLFRNGKPLANASGDASTLSLHRYGAGRFTLVAVDAAGNRSPESGAVTTVRNARPAHLRRWIPAWAWRVLRWQEHGKVGARPAAPRKLPGWYWTWEQWRLHPFRLTA